MKQKKRTRWRFVGMLFLAIPSLAVAVLAGVFFSTSGEERSRIMREQVVSILEAALPPEYHVKLDTLSFEFSGIHPAFSLGGVTVETGANAHSITFGRIIMELDAAALWRLTVSPLSLRVENGVIILPFMAAQQQEATAHIKLARDALAGLALALSQRDGRLTSLRLVEVNGINLQQRDAHGAQHSLSEGGIFRLTRMGEASIFAHIGRVGFTEALTFTLKPVEAEGNARAFQLEMAAFDVKTLTRLTGMAIPFFSPQMRVEAGLFLSQSEQNELTGAEARIALVGGQITLPDPDVPPFDIGHIELIAGLDPVDMAIAIRRLALKLGETDIRANGRMIPEAEGFRVTLAAEKMEIDRPSPEEPIVSLQNVNVEGLLSASLKTFTLNKLNLAHGAGLAEITGLFSLENGGRIDTNVSAQNLDLRAALRIWPISVAPPIRRWMIEHIQAGQISSLILRSSLADQALKDAFTHKPIPDDALQINLRIEGAKATPLRDATPLQEANVTAIITGRRADVRLEAASLTPKPNKPLKLRNADFKIADTSLQPATLEMDIPISGGLDAFLAFFEAPSLRPYVSSIPPDITILEGQMEGRARVALRLVAKPTPQDTKVEFTATLKGVAIDNVVKGEKLEAGNFQLSEKAGNLSLRGEAQFSGIPAQIELRGEPNEPVQASIRLTLDDAQRAKRGLGTKTILAGPVGVTITTQLQKSDALKMKVELDLLRAKIEGIAPGITKRVGQAASARFTLTQRPDGLLIEGLEAELGSIQAKGMLEFGKDQQLQKAELSSLKFSAGDNAQFQAERSRNLLKLSLRGNSFDVRPFLRGFQVGKIDDQKALDIDLDIQTTVILGFGGELISAAQVQASKRNGRLTLLTVKGRFGADAISVVTQKPGAEPLALSVETRNAGALLRFMEFYPRLVGGRLNAEIDVLAERQSGFVQVRDFALRGEAALQQFATNAVRDDARSALATSINPDEVDFTKLKADFTRRPGRLDVTEAVMWGPAIGGSLEGYLDYAGDKVDLKGSLVPAYALNNLFAQVPIFGQILGGSQYEGLFAMPFLINGKASSPVLRVNPLSVIAPGFLRKIFEVQREEKPAGQ